MYRFRKYIHSLNQLASDSEFKKLRQQFTHKYIFILVLSLLTHAYYLFENKFMLPVYCQIGICVLLLILLFYFPQRLYPHFSRYITATYVLFISLAILYYLIELSLISAYEIRNNTITQHSLWIIYGHTVVVICLNAWYHHKKSGLFLRVYKRKISQLSNRSNMQKQDPQITFLIELSELIKLAKGDDILLIPRFNTVYPLFHEKLWALNPKLSALEYKCCILLFLKFSTKDIASSNHISVRSVQTRKNRLRKHFDLSADTDLYQWIANL